MCVSVCVCVCVCVCVYKPLLPPDCSSVIGGNGLSERVVSVSVVNDSDSYIPSLSAKRRCAAGCTNTKVCLKAPLIVELRPKALYLRNHPRGLLTAKLPIPVVWWSGRRASIPVFRGSNPRQRMVIIRYPLKQEWKPCL